MKELTVLTISWAARVSWGGDGELEDEASLLHAGDHHRVGHQGKLVGDVDAELVDKEVVVP